MRLPKLSAVMERGSVSQRRLSPNGIATHCFLIYCYMTASLCPQNLVLELQNMWHTFACFLHDVPLESTVTPLNGDCYKSYRRNCPELNTSSVCIF